MLTPMFFLIFGVVCEGLLETSTGIKHQVIHSKAVATHNHTSSARDTTRIDTLTKTDAKKFGEKFLWELPPAVSLPGIALPYTLASD